MSRKTMRPLGSDDLLIGGYSGRMMAAGPMRRTKHRIARLAACVLVAGALGCTTTYTEEELKNEEPLAETVDGAVCPENSNALGCERNKPICQFGSDYGCLPGD